MNKNIHKKNSALKLAGIVIAGWLGGSLINMGFIQLVHTLIPIEGVDPSDMEAFAAVMPTLGYKYFIFPFLAHSIGTFVGALIAGFLVKTNKMKYSLIIGVLFLIGGILVNIMLPGPIWFAVTDTLLAYIPMAWIAGKVAEKY